MKKTFLVLTLIFSVLAVNAQTVQEIISKNNAATGYDKLAKSSTIYIEGKMSQMGTEIPLTMYVKQPGKIKMVMTYNGMDIITLYDGEKGYMVNPLSGSFEATEIPAESLDEIKKNDMFKNQLQTLLDQNQLQYVGDEDVDGKSAYKLMSSVEGKKPVYYFIDKESNLLVKTTTTVEQMGQEMTVDAYPKEYTDINGVKFPKVTTSVVNGMMEMGSMVFDVIEIDKPIEDSVFTIN